MSRPVVASALVVVVALLLGAGCTYEGTADPPGALEAFDAVAALPQVGAFVGPGARLIKLESRHVLSSGKQDLTAKYFTFYNPAVEYAFLRPVTAVDDPSLPVGARPARRPYDRVVVEIRRPQWLSSSRAGSYGSSNKKHLGMSQREFGGAEPGDVAPAPTCSLAQVWVAARKRGAPANAVATITYSRTGYTFVIPSTKVNLRFDGACRPLP